MIKDNLINLAYYNYLNPDIKKGLKFIRDAKFEELENGRHEIVEGKVYANIQEYTTKPEAEGKFEAHRKYVDIQFMIRGAEKMGAGDVEDFEEITQYDEEKDIVFLQPKAGVEDKLKFVKVNEREFTIFYPLDAHMPSLAIDNPAPVRKVIVKILLDI